MLLGRLDFGGDVRESLRFTFERWNGNGFPAHAKRDAIPLPMRVVHLTHDMEAIARHFSPARALEAARDRRDRTYDPAIVDLFLTSGAEWLDGLAATDPWDAVLDLEPRPFRMLDGAALDTALEVAADFIDLKSPYMAGHSRRCAALAADAARVLGLPEDTVTDLRRAALVAAGHGEPSAPPTARPRRPGGLSGRQVEVLRLAARGLTTRQIAEGLAITAKTADHHIQHIYNKIGVSTRAAAALWAAQHAVVG